jgi:hypothetical protein
MSPRRFAESIATELTVPESILLLSRDGHRRKTRSKAAVHGSHE